MKSTVAKVTFKKEFESRNGTMYSWHVTMDNGDMGETATKENKAPWEVGEEADYTTEDQTYGDKTYTKIKKAFVQGGGGKAWTPDPEKESRKERWAKQLIITRLAALNTAASLISSGGGESSVENLTGLAGKIIEWTFDGLDLKALSAGPPVAKVEAPAAKPKEVSRTQREAEETFTDRDDLPW